LIYITAKIIWQFLFYNTDYYENRAHVHVGKRDTQDLCKIWLEPDIELAKKGDLTDSQVKEVLEIVENHKDQLMQQWQNFKAGNKITIIRIKH